jgi:hypothetical protein
MAKGQLLAGLYPQENKMNYEELKENARKILANVPQGTFSDETFSCRSGGSPTNQLALPEVYRYRDFAYRTTANGDAYTGGVVLRCRKIGARDRDNREIFSHENGTLFVYIYTPGSPYGFDSGRICEPNVGHSI